MTKAVQVLGQWVSLGPRGGGGAVSSLSYLRSSKYLPQRVWTPELLKPDWEHHNLRILTITNAAGILSGCQAPHHCFPSSGSFNPHSSPTSRALLLFLLYFTNKETEAQGSHLRRGEAEVTACRAHTLKPTSSSERRAPLHLPSDSGTQPGLPAASLVHEMSALPLSGLTGTEMTTQRGSPDPGWFWWKTECRQQATLGSRRILFPGNRALANGPDGLSGVPDPTDTHRHGASAGRSQPDGLFISLMVLRSSARSFLLSSMRRQRSSQ